MIEYIHKELHPIDLVITVDGGLKSNIAGYQDIKSVAQDLGIPVHVVKKYSLKEEEDIDFFQQNTFELGISIGWQRLIPEEILNRFENGVFGFHGSSGYLPYGRGRSPINWSIINGHKRFINHCFQYNAEADKGRINSVRTFEINEFDTIQTLQYKTLLVGKEQIASLISQYRENSINLFQQSSNPSSWYPKRSPEDGKISLQTKTSDIYNLIRGVSKPFPGAFLLSSDNQKLIIWEAYPFDQIIDTFSYQVGEVLEVFGKQFILKTIDGTLFIKDYSYNQEIAKGDIYE
jgi:methionyl-tRNA formyltransferase